MLLQLHETYTGRRNGRIQNRNILLPLKDDCVIVACSVGAQGFQDCVPDLETEPTDGMPATDFISFEVPEQVRCDLLERRFGWRNTHVVDSVETNVGDSPNLSSEEVTIF